MKLWEKILVGVVLVMFTLATLSWLTSDQAKAESGFSLHVPGFSMYMSERKPHHHRRKYRKRYVPLPRRNPYRFSCNIWSHYCADLFPWDWRYYRCMRSKGC